CYDISHIQGFATVASMVVFVDGRPEKSRYRTYKVKSGDRPDDFASMYEVLSRRFRRARELQAGKGGEAAEGAIAREGADAAETVEEHEGDKSHWALPDLIVID